ncbi:MAG: hypothetical protein RLZZ27_986, partial [Actinomycetota bacterium]
IGIDADADPIGEAAAWQIAFEEVTRFSGNDLPINGSTASVVQEVMDLSTQLAENDRSANEIIDYTEKLLSKLSQKSCNSGWQSCRLWMLLIAGEKKMDS